MKLSVYHAWYKLVNSGEECVNPEAGNVIEISLLSLPPCLVTKTIYQHWLKVRTSVPDEILTFLTFHFIPNWKKTKLFFMFPINAPENNNSRFAHMTVPLIRRKEMFLVSNTKLFHYHSKKRHFEISHFLEQSTVCIHSLQLYLV